MITVQDILEIPGLNLRLLAGGKAVGNPVRWVHIAEMSDPTQLAEGRRAAAHHRATAGRAREAEQLAMLSG